LLHVSAVRVRRIVNTRPETACEILKQATPAHLTIDLRMRVDFNIFFKGLICAYVIFDNNDMVYRQNAYNKNINKYNKN